ncbi:MAG: hypothetical protein IK143_02850 [Bacteroidales bacterium]|nr:hypothetical protein [Bacteroidales bacterium]
MRLAIWHPERIDAIISQNGNCYEDGLGKNDPSFIPAGAEAFKRDLPNADVRYVDSGHFALESHHSEIAGYIRKFLK